MSLPEKHQKSLSPVPSHDGQVLEGQHDAVFGEITEAGPNYRSVCPGHFLICYIRLLTTL